jgi:hypothetical protein
MKLKGGHFMATTEIRDLLTWLKEKTRESELRFALQIAWLDDGATAEDLDKLKTIKKLYTQDLDRPQLQIESMFTCC